MNIRKHIPNSITCLNLLCGVAGIIALLSFKAPIAAFCFMLAGAGFDFCDGLSARLLGAYSPVGKELDSLADDITFGALPALMMHIAMTNGGMTPDNPLCWIPLLIAAFSALRLAKFNLDERQSSGFIGLPTPACAMICGSICCLAAKGVWTGLFSSSWFIPAFSLLLCWLLVCEIPMFSMKIHKGDRIGADRIAFFAVTAAAAILAIVFKWHWSAITLISFTSYILINLAAKIWQKR